MTLQEKQLFRILNDFYGEEYRIFAHAHLSYIIGMKKHPLSWPPLYRLAGESVDFLICDRKNIDPVLALELDERDEHVSDLLARGAFIDKVFQTIGISLIRIDASSLERIELLWETINAALIPRTGNTV